MPLVVLHNLSARKLASLETWGALAAPSLAVLEAGSRFGAYGEITLVAPPSLADPSVEPAARLWTRDVYTPEVSEYDVPSTLAEAMALIESAPATAHPRSCRTFNIGRLRTAWAKPLNSLDDAEAARDQLMDRGAWDEAMMALNRPVCRAYFDLHAHGPTVSVEAFPMACVGETHDGMLKAMALHALGEGTMRSCLREFGFVRVPKTLVARIEALSRTIEAVPVPYFEAKVSRAVALDEFAAAVVPDDLPEDVVDSLRRSVGRVERYPTDGDRGRVVAETAEAVGAIHAGVASSAPAF